MYSYYMLIRYITPQIKHDLAHKMVFLGGPRQVGKTTCALSLATSKDSYLNWDIAAHREAILKHELPTSKLIIFDEIHKYKSWRNYLKGIYDLYRQDKHILVTGSARLDLYRYSGDSLQGRYHFLRMHPLSIAELKINSQKGLLDLLELGGFPEPFLQGSTIDAKRWSREYRTRLIREDIGSVERVQDLGQLELLMLRLPELVGSPLSLNSMREDLQVSHKTITHWADILERMYAIFRLCPLGSNRVRAVKKEQKHYHTDWTLINDQPKRFENFMASHLLKWVHFQQDTQGRDLELCYFRDIDKREVDFVIVENNQPTMLIEAKWSDDTISPHLKYLKNKYPKASALQVHAVGKKDYQSPEGIRVTSALKFLSTLV